MRIMTPPAQAELTGVKGPLMSDGHPNDAALDNPGVGTLQKVPLARTKNLRRLLLLMTRTRHDARLPERLRLARRRHAGDPHRPFRVGRW